jgi:endonuclease/exonuclease/phosphatase family metal-dependent hydrolase
MHKLIRSILFFFTLLSAMSLLLAYLSVYIKPTVFWIFGMVGLAYPVLLLLNVAIMVFWILRWRWEFIVPVLAILIGVGHFSSFFQFPFGKTNTVSQNDIKIVTYNVNLFQLYSWSKEPPTHNNIFEFLKEQNPDIICLQEFYVVDGKFSERQAKAKLDYNVHIGYITKRKNSGYGLATYSRHPIVGTGQIKFDKSANSCIYTDLLIGNDTVRVYNNHLQSLRLKERNINFLLNQGQGKESQPMDEIRDLSFRYRDALQKRALQVEKVTNHILKSPYPVIVCGDFNDSPISYNYHQMRHNLSDAFVEAGVGVGHTYQEYFPSFRIDYILYSPILKATSYRSPRVKYSDHYPVVATLKAIGFSAN